MNENIYSNNDSTNTNATSDIDVDFTATRVREYMKDLKVVNKFKTHHIFLIKYLNCKARPKVYTDKKDIIMFIYNVLNTNKSTDSFIDVLINCRPIVVSCRKTITAKLK